MNKLGILSQGIEHITWNDCINFIVQTNVLLNKKVIHTNVACDYRPLKNEKYRVRLRGGGDKSDYNFDTTSPATLLIETKLLLNIVISDSLKGARFMTLNIKRLSSTN